MENVKTAKGYKVYVNVEGDDWNTNAIIYKSKEEAERAGADLFSRWTAVKKYEIRGEA